jgi:hypothetical protein
MSARQICLYKLKLGLRLPGGGDDEASLQWWAYDESARRGSLKPLTSAWFGGNANACLTRVALDGGSHEWVHSHVVRHCSLGHETEADELKRRAYCCSRP